MYVIHGLTQAAESCSEAIKCLHNRYDLLRITHSEHVRSILQAPIMKANSGKELRKLYDVCKQHIRAIQLSNHLDLETFLTIAIELKMVEATRLKWMEHSNDSKKMPPYCELLEFLDMQARHHESVTSERKQVMSEHKPHTTTHRTYATTVGREEACFVCRKGNHPLGDCAKFQGTMREERWEIVKRVALCKNCLKPGCIAKSVANF